MNSSFCSPILTSSTARVFERFCSFAARSDTPAAGHLVLAIIAEESLGSSQLNDFGMRLDTLANGLLGAEIASSSLDVENEQTVGHSENNDHSKLRRDLTRLDGVNWIIPILDRSISIARRRQEPSASTLDVVLAMAEVEGPARDILQQQGMTSEVLNTRLGIAESLGETLAVDEDFQLLPEDEDVDDGVEVSVGTSSTLESFDDRVPALLDANLNRCREGLRVLDDFCRFILRDESLTRQLKQLRHRLVAAEQTLYVALPTLINFRDVAGDAGTDITTDSELNKGSVNDLVAANCRRVQESLRSLEEFGKLYCASFSTEMKSIRYESYTLHQSFSDFQTAQKSGSYSWERSERIKRLIAAKLYILLTESLCNRPWKMVVEECLAGGADVIQLREKQLAATEIVSRGKWIAAACRNAGALFIMNDRPDLAVLAEADGVHVGQDDICPADVRQVVGSARLIGLSTHSPGQIREAVACTDVDYLGVGPVFPSTTKSFQQFPGLQLVQAADEIATRPWFSIGGIDESNLERLIASGASRAAVCGAVIGEDDPQKQAANLRTLLAEHGTGEPAVDISESWLS